jgi:putative transposase
MIEKEHPAISIRRQSELLGISRSAVYYQPGKVRDEHDIEELQEILKVLEVIPFYGYRKVVLELRKQGTISTRKRVRRIMRKFGLRAIFSKPNLSKARKEHKKYPYLLSGKVIRYPNQVWASDLTYIRLPGGHVYLVAIIDLYSRKVLSWRLSNSMKADFCVEALEEAIEKYGSPAIFNTDQGSQFTSDEFIGILKKHYIRISMDGKGRALDNIYIERLWRTLKYEDIYIKGYESMNSLKDGLKRYFDFYNTVRFHQSLDYQVPDEKYESFQTRDQEIIPAA